MQGVARHQRDVILPACTSGRSRSARWMVGNTKNPSTIVFGRYPMYSLQGVPKGLIVNSTVLPCSGDNLS